MTTLLVNEMFLSIQGEGIYTGKPMVFVRFQGCNLIPRCQFCDSSKAMSSRGGITLSVEEIVQAAVKLSPQLRSWVCITGGEPMWQSEGLEELVGKFGAWGWNTTVETNGSFECPDWYTQVKSWNADIKCPSSGVCGTSKESWFNTRYCDQIKFVVGTKEDLDFTRQMIRKHLASKATILVSPIITSESTAFTVEQKWLQEVAKFCVKERVRFSLQIHKVVGVA